MLTQLITRAIRGARQATACGMLLPLLYVYVGDSQAMADEFASAWKRHTIDHSSQGADGVRPLDVNGDGRLDLVTGWEEGGQIRIYLHPGAKSVKDKWPAATVGNVASPEDAVFVDLDADGAIDVVSCCEGMNLTVYAHWAPSSRDALLESSAWKTEPFPVLAGKQAFMFCLPMQIDGERGVDLVIGAKSRSKAQLAASQVGWLESPQDPRQLQDWRWHPLYEAGWIMSLFAEDMDHDGDLDILLTDRMGVDRGCKWLENPGTARAAKGELWQQHPVGGSDTEIMFIARGDLDGDGRLDIAAATHDSGLRVFRGLDDSGDRWETLTIPMPANTGGGKGIEIGDIDLDGSMDLIVSCEHAQDKHGVFWLKRADSTSATSWEFRPISGELGIKFDLIQLIDLDEDGDLDVLTCEERAQLGVTWYENPAR